MKAQSRAQCSSTASSAGAIRFASLIAPLALAVAVSACNSGAAGSTSETSSLGAPVMGGNQSSNPSNGGGVPVGESCTSADPEKICLAVHFVTYNDSSGNPVASTNQAATITRTMNQLFSQCNIGFQIERYDRVNPADYGLSYGAQSQSETNQIRQTFADPTNQLLSVTTGPWGTAVNAWTSMPGEGTYGAVMEASIVDYGGGIIYAHEFGHYLGLDHVGDSSDLMNPVISTNSTRLDSTQCQVARDTARQYWAAMIRR